MKRYALISFSLVIFSLPLSVQCVTNTWDGSAGTAWYLGSNWSQGHAPLSDEDVIIPTGLTNYPYISNTISGTCNSVAMQASTSLTVDGSLTVAGDLNCYGSLAFNNSNADLYIGDDLLFQSGSTLTISFSGAEFHIADGLVCYAGSNVNPNRGRFRFTGPNANINTFANTTLGDIYIEGAFCQRDAGTGSLTLMGSLIVNSSCALSTIVNSTLTIYGNISVGSAGSLTFDIGIVKLMGSANSTVSLRSLDYFYHFIVEKDAGASVIQNTLLTVRGNLTINSGTLDSGSQMIYLYGNWNNIAGESGFSSGAGWVAFVGTGTSIVMTDQEFHGMSNQKTAGELVIEADKTVSAALLSLNTGTLNILGSLTTNWQYDYIEGTIIVAGTYNHTDISGADQHITGTLSVLAGGTAHFIGSDHNLYVDNGGTLNIAGDLWLTESDLMFNTGSLGSMSSGSLYVDGNLYFYRQDWPISGGTIHLTGSENCVFSPPNSVDNLSVEKSSNSVYVDVIDRDLSVQGTLSVTSGIFGFSGLYDLYLYQDCQVSGLMYFYNGASLFIAPNRTFTLNSTGSLNFIGGQDNPCSVSRAGATGNYNLIVYGMIYAHYTIFEYMGANGVQLMPGCSFGTYAILKNCTFRNGANGGTLLTANCDRDILVYGENFPANTGGCNYNVTKTNNAGSVHFVQSAGSFSGALFENDPYSRVFWSSTLLPPELSISLSSDGASYQLHGEFPYEGAVWRLYKSTDSVYGPFDIISTGSTSFSMNPSYPLTGSGVFYRITTFME